MVEFINGKRTDGKTTPGGGDTAVYFWSAEECDEAARVMAGSGVTALLRDESPASRFESHRGYDCLLLSIPDASAEIEAAPLQLDIYLTPARLFVICEDEKVLGEFVRQLETGDSEERQTAAHILYILLLQLTSKDTQRLEDIEEEIAKLEDMLATDEEIDYTAEISVLRRRLLKLKRYYESLLAVVLELVENENELLDKAALRYLRGVGSRVDRLYRSVLNLRDYVTQVREAYQAQVDISLNQTMKLFTVITSIFLPLSFIAGWFGMNLQMPETSSPWAYPVVIVVSLAIVVGCVAMFKKRKWF